MKVDIYINTKHIAVYPNNIIFEDKKVDIKEDDFSHLLGLLRETEEIDSPYFLDEDTINITMSEDDKVKVVCNGYINNYGEIRDWLRQHYDRI